MSKFLDQQGLSVLWELIKNGYQPIRRATEAEYGTTFTPKRGEVCLVDTNRDGLRIKVGDGVTAFNYLEYEEPGRNTIMKGFYDQNHFYYDKQHTQLMECAPNRLYIDLTDNALYYCEGDIYVQLNYIPLATAQVAGVMKLYDDKGQNVDGTMTQKSITDEVNKKFEVQVSSGVLTFTH